MKRFNDLGFFTLFCLYFLGLGFLAIILTIFGFFYAWIFLAYLIICAAGLIYFIIQNKFNIKPDWATLAVVIISMAVIILWSFYATPTIFSGRDQGSFSSAAIYLTQNHQLQFSNPSEKEFFNIYGPGQALNFPGYYYTGSGNLITQFPIGYIAWLAVFYSLFGLVGLIIANAVAFFLFIISFFELAKIYFKKNFALLTILFVLTQFIFSWFSKFTLSENLALALVWLGIWQFVLFLNSRRRIHALAALSSFGLLLFTRIEGLAFMAMAIIILFFIFRQPKKIYLALGKNILAFAIAIIAIYILSIWANFDFYRTFAKGFLSSLSPASGASGNLPVISPIIYLFKVFSTYAILDFLLIGFLGIIMLIWKKNWNNLIPFFIIFPSFVYLIHPSISADQPWMLRRYLFAVIPGCILYAAIFLDSFFQKKYLAYAISAILLIANIAAILPLLPFSENKNLLAQTKNLVSNFKDSDLVLVDREAAGNGWAMITGPLNFLYDIQAVYFFNPNDLNKINKNYFSNVYLIIPDKNSGMYAALSGRLTLVKNYKISNENLGTDDPAADISSSAPVIYPQIQYNITYGKIYLLK